jgi:hypothetical protein
MEEKYNNIINKEKEIKKENWPNYEKELENIKKEKREIRRIINARKNMVYCKECKRFVEQRNIDMHNMSELHKKNYEDIKIFCDICDEIVIRKDFTYHIESDNHKKNAFDIKMGFITRTKNFEVLI